MTDSGFDDVSAYVFSGIINLKGNGYVLPINPTIGNAQKRLHHIHCIFPDPSDGKISLAFFEIGLNK